MFFAKNIFHTVCFSVFILFSFTVNAAFNLNQLEKSDLKIQRYELGLKKLSLIKDQINEAHYKDGIHLAESLIAQENKNCQDALQKIKNIKTTSVIFSHALLVKAQCLIDLGQSQKALESLASVQKPSSKTDWDLFWVKINALSEQKQSATLVSTLQPFEKKFAKDKSFTIKKNFYLGKSYLLQKDRSKALQFFQRVLLETPGTFYDNKIYALLKEYDKKPFQLSRSSLDRRAESLINNGFAHKAVKIYESLYKHSSSENKKFYKEKIAYATFKNRDYKKAIHLYKKIIDNNESGDELQNLIQLAQSYARSDHFAEAIATNKLIMQKFPGTRSAALSRYKIGYLAYDSGDFEQSNRYFENYVKNANLSQRKQGYTFLFWGYYFTKQYQKAKDMLAALVKLTQRKNDLITLDYWFARTLEKLGKKSEAHSIYQKVFSLDKRGYYGLLAYQRIQNKSLAEKTLFQLSSLMTVPTQEQTPQKKSKKTATKNVAPVSAKISSQLDKNLIAAVILAQIGLDSDAFYKASESPLIAGVPQTSVLLSLPSAGHFNKGLSLQKQLTEGTIANIDKLVGYQISYPLAYQDYIEAYSSHWGIDKFLGYAIMRQESAFKPQALSYAYAYGLMQIIPPTAQEIVDDIDFENFEMETLNQPLFNTLFGTYYLSKLMKTFDGNLVSTMAGYNAGPDAVSRWRHKNYYAEEDEFVENIPYGQTRDYVKKVLVNYMIYKKLYGN